MLEAMPIPILPVIYDAFLRPTRFARLLAHSEQGRLHALVAVTVWVVCVMFAILLTLRVFVPFELSRLLIHFGLASAIGVLLSVFGILSNDPSKSTMPQVLFWVLRSQLIVTIPFVLALAIGITIIPQAEPLIFLLVLAYVAGFWLADVFTIYLIRGSHVVEGRVVRYLWASSALVFGCFLWFFPPLGLLELRLLSISLIALSIGLIRPLLWFAEATCALLLTVPALAGVPAHTLRPFHPVSLDELCVLPLPALRFLLVRACRGELHAGMEWLLAVADHAGQRSVARAVVDNIVCEANLAHALLFSLSTRKRGMELLHSRIVAGTIIDPLIVAYDSFSNVATPDAWLGALVEQQFVFGSAAWMQDGKLMQMVVDTGAKVLAADRWSAAIAVFRDEPVINAVVIADIQFMLETLRTWVWNTCADGGFQIQTPISLVAEVQQLHGWPKELLAAIVDHLSFLRLIEQRRTGR